jgi:hypothetical protein
MRKKDWLHIRAYGAILILSGGVLATPFPGTVATSAGEGIVSDGAASPYGDGPDGPCQRTGSFI